MNFIEINRKCDIFSTERTMKIRKERLNVTYQKKAKLI